MFKKIFKTKKALFSISISLILLFGASLFSVYGFPGGGGVTAPLERGLVGHWSFDGDSHGTDVNIAPFSDYSNRNYGQVYSPSCWGGDEATIQYFSSGGYNNLPYKKLSKTSGGDGGCYLNDNQFFEIENNKTYVISAYIKASRNQIFNGHLLNINRPIDNRYRLAGNWNVTTEWEKYSWIYESGNDHAGDYHTRHIIYINDNLPLDVYWSDFKVEEIKLKDKTPYANHGSITGTSIVEDRYGKEDSAMSFNGVDDFVKIDGNIASTNNVTITGWALIDSSGYIVNQFQSTGLSWAIRGTSNSIGIFNDTLGVSNLIHFDTTIPTGEWVHFAGGHNDNGWFFYVNGELIGEGLQSGGGPSTVSGDLFFGQRGNNSAFFSGKLDDVRVYNRALSGEEVSLLYDSYKPKIQASSINRGLVAHWPLDADSFNSANNRVSDLSPYANHGVNNGATLTEDRHGKSGGAMRFDGSSDQVIIDKSGIVNNPSELTIAAWFKKDGDGHTYECVLHQSSNYTISNSSFWLGLDSNDYFTATIGARTGVGWAAGQTNIKPVLGEWNHLLATWDGSMVRVYLNGEYVKEYALSTYSTLNTPVRIGASSATYYHFNGTMNDIRIYNRALSEYEVKLLYDSYSPKSNIGSLQKGLVLDMPLTSAWTKTETPGSQIMTDKTPYSNDGQNVSATIHNNRANFNGSSYVQFNNPIDQSNLDQEWSISAWVNIENTGSTQYLISGLNMGARLVHGSTDRALLYLNSGENDYYVYSDDSGLLAGQGWRHVVFVFRNSDGYRKIYIDGEDRSGSGPNRTSTPSGASSLLRIGQSSQGDIADVRIYNRALSGEEIKLLYDRGSLYD